MPESDAVSLRDYVDVMFAERDKAVSAALLAQGKAVSAALDSSDKAITKAEANAEKWRENANEWRVAMSDPRSRAAVTSRGRDARCRSRRSARHRRGTPGAQRW
jgi:hypothetical protein